MEHLYTNKDFQKALAVIAQNSDQEFEQILNEAKEYFKELYTEQNPIFNTIAVELAHYILGRAYEKTIDVNHKELKELAKIMRKNSVAFVMTHKTYIDMFVLGVVLVRHGLPLPYIFSGINMSFLGLGEFGRKTGAIFIRRSFRDNEVYKLALRHFISDLVDKMEHFMWAIEGTRSRTGKLVWPKMGILKYILDAESVSKSNVKYIPVSIVYDLIPDVQDMIKEGRGKDKKPESLLWFINYVRKMGDDHGRISIRFGKPIDQAVETISELPLEQLSQKKGKPFISKFAFELVHGINQVTPVTTTSLVCTALLSKFALQKKEIESIVSELMSLIEIHKADALVDRGKPIGQSIQDAINLLLKSDIIQQMGVGHTAKYALVPENYLTANYYSNMAVHHFYHRAFIELALLKARKVKPDLRESALWQEIMNLRSLFKFEFFYSKKVIFSEECEIDLQYLDDKWHKKLHGAPKQIEAILSKQNILTSSVVLSTYVEAYKVVAKSLLSLDPNLGYTDDELLSACVFYGEEMHWKGKIHRVESVSKPFLLNGIRYARNEALIPNAVDDRKDALRNWLAELEDISTRILETQDLADQGRITSKQLIPFEKQVVPGSKTASVVEEVMMSEEGPHIGAFFDLDRTLIAGFSAKEFFQTRMMSGKMTAKEIIAQFNGVFVYATGNKNFASMAAIGAKGIKGVNESVFIEVGEQVYLDHLSKAIYPESRALVEAHISKGHTVAIISAATPYQVGPVARDLGIDHVLCTEMEVVNGKFTGNIIEPACWGEGKAKAGERIADSENLDLSKSYFYTDSNEDLPLLEIVGKPRPVNPDSKLSSIAFENDWPIFRFNDEDRPGVQNILRSVFAFGSMVPAAMMGALSGSFNMSWKDGINSMISMVGDLGTKLSGIDLLVKGEENLWKYRPAVFIFNHQSNADLLIMAKLVRKNVTALAKKELIYTPAGPIFKAAGVIFIDRKNTAKAIEAMKPAVDALKSGTSVAVAPEGTRSYDYKLGKFKKGAFHLAMQADVPIIPIVIKNAHDAMPRGSSMMTPTFVEVEILDPVKTTDWTKENMDVKIESIRRQYLKHLGQTELKVV